MGHTHYYKFADKEGIQAILDNDNLWGEYRKEIMAYLSTLDYVPYRLILNEDEIRIDFNDPIGYETFGLERKRGLNLTKTYFGPRKDDGHIIYDNIIFELLKRLCSVYGPWVNVRSDRSDQEEIYQDIINEVDSKMELML
tara:strand:- start:2004 stop:2423 length:420 start_codon:yes stop_codon:yes gene_type:complete